MSFRDEQKKQRKIVSSSLMDAALELSAREGYASLSLRSVAREAGIAPTSFYRHFREMDEMGEALVQKAGQVLEDFFKAVRGRISLPAIAEGAAPDAVLASVENIARPFVATFMDFFKENKNLLVLFFQERTGSSRALRAVIADYRDNLVQSLAAELKKLFKEAGAPLADTLPAADTMLTLASCAGLEAVAGYGSGFEGLASRAVENIRVFLAGCVLCRPKGAS